MYKKQTMDRYSVLSRICLGISIFSLVLAYGLAGDWQIVLALLGSAAVWFFLRKRSTFWSKAALLFLSVLLAAVGILLNLSLFLLLLAVITSLVAWDLDGFQRSMASNQKSEQEILLERYHLKSLLAVVCLGGLPALLGSALSLSLSLAGAAVLVLVTVGGLIYAAKAGSKLD